MSDVQRALILTWLILGGVSATVVGASFAVPDGWLGALLPVCEWRARYGTDCPMCGLTRAFAAIATGRWGDAWVLNQASIPLFGLMSIHGGGAIVTVRPFLRAWQEDRRSKER